jgi:transposase
VEVGVQVVERWILARLRNWKFFSLDDLNSAIHDFLAEINDRTMEHLGKSRRELFEALDQPALRPLPGLPYEFAIWKKARVHIDYHIEFDKHYYSVPYTLIRKEVFVRATERTLEVFFKHQRVASHPRSRDRGRFSTIPEHMSPAHRKYSEWSPDRFLRWAEKIGPHTAQLVEAVLASRRHPQQAYRSCLGILHLSKRYTDERLEAACRRAFPAGIRSYKGIKNILDTKLDQLQPEEPTTAALTTHANIRGQSYYS